MNEIKYIEPQQEDQLYNDVCQIIDGARGRIATYVNTEACLTNWYVGKRIKEDVLYNKRAEYGKQIVINLSLKLTERYGSGWSEKTLRHCLRNAETIDLDSPEKSDVYQRPPRASVYAQMCSTEHWDTRTLDEKIDKQLYLQTALSRKPEEVIKKELEESKSKNQLLPDMVFRSSYFLDILGLPDVFSEKDLENAILGQVEEFLSELGSDFTFVKRQKRITVDAVDYYIDLLFFHRELRRLVAIDLKLGKFKPEHEGQMRLYLRYLNQNDRKPWEESPIGLILCSEGNTEHIEYLMLDEEVQSKWHSITQNCQTKNCFPRNSARLLPLPGNTIKNYPIMVKKTKKNKSNEYESSFSPPKVFIL